MPNGLKRQLASFATSKWHTLIDWQNSLETIDSALMMSSTGENDLKRRFLLQNGHFDKFAEFFGNI